MMRCLYGGVGDDEVRVYSYVIREMTPSSNHKSSVTNDETVDRLTASISRSISSNLTSISDGKLRFVGWRLIITENSSDKPQDPNGSAATAIYHNNHILLLYNNSETLTLHDISSDGVVETTPRVLDLRIGDKIRGVSSTDRLLVLYTEQGALWTVSHTLTNPNPQSVFLFSKKVRQVSCGKEHTAVLTTLGEVYTFGGGSRGQLGQGSLESSTTPQLVEKLSGIFSTRVEAGGWHTLVLSDIGDVYSWGWNESGQVGVSCTKDTSGDNKPPGNDGHSMIIYPVLLFEDDTELVVVDVSCGSRHSAAVADDGRLYTWGWNGYRQLFLPSDITVQDTPRLVNTDIAKFRKIRCGGWSSFAFIDDDLEQRTVIGGT